MRWVEHGAYLGNITRKRKERDLSAHYIKMSLKNTDYQGVE
jgi:hypothetical protein